MAVQTNIGKIGAAIESGRRAAASIDYGPIKGLNTIASEQGIIVGDWQFSPSDSTIFLFGFDTWAIPNKMVTK